MYVFMLRRRLVLLSDGYNLGQFRLTGNKLHSYEQTLRIPMFVRGPGIQPGTVLSIPGSNTDFAPTWLALAGVSNSHMDGSSFASHLLSSAEPKSRQQRVHKRDSTDDGTAADGTNNWRDFHYSEYNSLGNLWRGGGEIIHGDHLIDDPVSHTFRAVRFVDSKEHGNALYCEYTSLIDWNYQNYSSAAGVLDPHSYKFYELFNLDADPWQLTNIYHNASALVKRKLHTLVASEFRCSGATCT
jgi:N-acetylglucosamine-6-sulfatase